MMDSTTPLTLTKEQQAILASKGDIRINAVAGSGKTSTLIAYAASRPPHSRILYLAFNRSVKQEATRRFAEEGLRNVQVETAHSLAYRAIVPSGRYKVRTQGFKTHEIVQLLQLKGSGEKHTEYILANHINRFISWFCNSEAARVTELNYLDLIHDEKARAYVEQHYREIEHGTRLLLAQMDSGQIEIIHDFYLKKFQLSRPQLPYDYILFDEGQDASGAMLDIFLRQNAVKVIVGDTHQQIYSWRFAVNSLERTPFSSYQLSTSFRFYPSVAELAQSILKWKEKLDLDGDVQITGRGNSKERKSKATLARTNLGLLVAAVEYISDPRNPRKIYFEGNIHSYTYADDGASLYDVLGLYQGNPDRIRDPLVKSMRDLDELEEYVEKTEDPQLGMMIELVKEYSTQLPGIIKELKELHIGDEERDQAAMIFSTVHRAKGMEYDEVFLADDFVNEKKLDRWKTQEGGSDKHKWKEEINLLYVAVTRARHILHIPETLIPEGFPPKPHIRIIPKKAEDHNKKTEPTANSYWKQRMNAKLKPSEGFKKKYFVKEKSAGYRDSSSGWNEDMDEQLRELFQQGITIAVIAEELNQTKGAIVVRLKKFNYFM